MVEKIVSKHNATYVGRLTSAGDRDLYFYFGDTTLYDKTISEVMVAYPKYQFDFGSEGRQKMGRLFWLSLSSTTTISKHSKQTSNWTNLEKGDKLTKRKRCVSLDLLQIGKRQRKVFQRRS